MKQFILSLLLILVLALLNKCRPPQSTPIVNIETKYDTIVSFDTINKIETKIVLKDKTVHDTILKTVDCPILPRLRRAKNTTIIINSKVDTAAIIAGKMKVNGGNVGGEGNIAKPSYGMKNSTVALISFILFFLGAGSGFLIAKKV